MPIGWAEISLNRFKSKIEKMLNKYNFAFETVHPVFHPASWFWSETTNKETHQVMNDDDDDDGDDDEQNSKEENTPGDIYLKFQ